MAAATPYGIARSSNGISQPSGRRQMRKSDQGSVRFAPVWDSKVSHYRLACFAQRRRALWACLGEMCRCCILPPWMAVYNCGVGAHDGHLGLQRRRSIPVALPVRVLMTYLEGISWLTARNCAF